jgi:hypothetical protein
MYLYFFSKGKLFIVYLEKKIYQMMDGFFYQDSPKPQKSFFVSSETILALQSQVRDPVK